MRHPKTTPAIGTEIKATLAQIALQFAIQDFSDFGLTVRAYRGYIFFFFKGYH
jgi:hypothetical protein